MADRIKGITVEIGGDTTKLSKALESVNKSIRTTQGCLTDVNKLLKMDPGNLELLSQKQSYLSKAIADTEEKLKAEKEAYEQLKNTDGFDKNSDQAKNLRREIEATTIKLNELKDAVGSLDSSASSFSAMGEKMKALGDSLKDSGEKIKATGDKIKDVGGDLTKKVTTPILGLGAAAAKSAIDFEDAFTGVKKTVDETATTSYEDLSKAIQEMATVTASSQAEIAGVMEAAGQLGVGADNIVDFTKTMIMLGDTTNLSADEAATALARFANITGTSLDDVDRLGSVIVDLGNNYATTESEIVNMATRLASAGTIAGLSETEILGLSAAMTSVGINAEAGGTAMSQTLTTISKAVELAGTAGDENGKWAASLQTIADITGYTAEGFQELWKQEGGAGELTEEFIRALGVMGENGESALVALDDLGMTGIRQSNMLQSLALAYDMTGQAVNTANTAFSENTALSAEAEKRYGTTASQIEQLKSGFVNVGISFGQILLPYLQQGIGFLQDLAAKMQALSPEQQSMIVHIAAIAAAVGPILVVIGTVISSIGGIVSAIGTVISVGGTLIGAIGALSPPMLIVAGVVGALILVGVALYKNWDTIKAKAQELGAKLSEKWNAIKTSTKQAFDNVKESVSGAMNSVKEKCSNAWDNVKSATSTAQNLIASVVKGKLNEVKSAYESHGGGIKGTAAAIWTVMTEKYRTGFQVINTLSHGKLSELTNKFKDQLGQIPQKAQEALESARQKFNEKLEAVKTLVSNALNAVSGFFKNLHLELPQIKTPHFKFTNWSPNPVDWVSKGMPGIEIEWYKKAMGNGMILNGPTIFGYSGGKLLGGGEAGSETVVGTASLMAMIQKATGGGINPADIYDAVREGASNAEIIINLDNREMGRSLRKMGVVFA
ncbi:phage tail tape measure protein [Butyrivibrio sp. AD3002]|uniref:phage tail tape measure protein n=1 Tax=Butyrivibrio sp. AD3002 TaxID=1280670 RepID=UPI0003B600D3|nr:phage tail tape measure protein [Butyrivibrio sp. AD3002]